MKQPSQRTLLRLLHHNWNPRTLTALSYICERFLFRGCFSEIEVLGLEEVAAKSAAGRRLILIPDHQSEYDWLILQSRMFRSGIHTAIQAGDNLFVGPLDPVLRGCGAFMSVRDKHSFYSSHWIANMAFKHLGKKPIVITRDMYSTLYNKQLKRILGREGFNILVFPGYETDPYSGAVKYGRSYSGLFNPLSPYVFIMMSKALKELGIRDAEYIPVSISYERVPEDSLFREFKATSRRKKIFKYIYDHYYTFFKAPFSKELRQEKTRVCVKFGTGLPVDFGGKARQFAEQIHYEIGRLVRVYESTLVFHSVNNKFIIPKKELKVNMQRDLEKLHRLGVDCSPLYDDAGRLYPLERMLRRVESIFNFPKNPVSPLKSYVTMEHDKNEVFILNPHLASYYANKLRYIMSRD
ncbi:MAG: 1-acyl-sn-glycerol-3-phosphate acyltransferase [Spirochaetales bacterium]|nr:1-acyl-sn-glycerol-3-phosphate acyltransferase [Spirochaetales bacterium]